MLKKLTLAQATKVLRAKEAGFYSPRYPGAVPHDKQMIVLLKNNLYLLPVNEFSLNTKDLGDTTVFAVCCNNEELIPILQEEMKNNLSQHTCGPVHETGGQLWPPIA